jgi:hypothetical protein
MCKTRRRSSGASYAAGVRRQAMRIGRLLLVASDERHFVRSLATLGIVCFALFRAWPADAQVKPGEFFSADNAGKIRALLRHGQLFKSFANWLTYRDRPVPDARVAIYPFKRVFEVAETTTDVQSGLAETCFLPSPDTRERETWYINMGASDKSMFTLQAVIDAAHRTIAYRTNRLRRSGTGGPPLPKGQEQENPEQADQIGDPQVARPMRAKIDSRDRADCQDHDRSYGDDPA